MRKLLEAARQVVFFDGPTEQNLQELREQVIAADNAERFHPPTDEDDDTPEWAL